MCSYIIHYTHTSVNFLYKKIERKREKRPESKETEIPREGDCPSRRNTTGRKCTPEPSHGVWDKRLPSLIKQPKGGRLSPVAATRQGTPSTAKPTHSAWNKNTPPALTNPAYGKIPA